MQFTLAVFDPETCEGVSYKNISRSSLAFELGLDNVNSDVPLLHALVANTMKEQNISGVSGTNADKQSTSGLIDHVEAKLGNLKGRLMLLLSSKMIFPYCVLFNTIYSTKNRGL
jgi:hypothetical protein